MKEIPYVNLAAQWHEDRSELLPIIETVLARGIYVGGDEVEQFERAVAKVCNCQYAIALNSGTDALVCALHAMGIGRGDEVITPPNSFIASTAAIVHTGASPVFVDVQPDQNIDPDLIEAVVTSKTRAIMPVHLTGRISNMLAINTIATKYNLAVIEDAAQAIGSRLGGKPSGSLGSIGCFSTHPLKNLNACGDGGFVTTNNEVLGEKIRLMRNHGLLDRNTVEQFGIVSRMDTLQAAILNFRLDRLPDVIEKRRCNAKLYRDVLDSANVFVPPEEDNEFNTYHTFVIQVDRRTDLQEHLHSNNIHTTIHYPVPIHLQPAARNLGYRNGDFPVTEAQSGRILTLHVNQYLEENDIQ